MIIKTLIFFHIIFAADLQDISNRLADNDYKVRTAAMNEAKKLTDEEKLALIQILKKSKDPEKTESAKALGAMITSHSFEKMSELISEGKNKDFLKAVSINPEILKLTKNKVNLLDSALIAKNAELIKFLKFKGLKSKFTGLKTIDVLVVKSDTWKSLADDFSTTVELIRMVNHGVDALKPGDIIKVPRK